MHVRNIKAIGYRLSGFARIKCFILSLTWNCPRRRAQVHQQFLKSQRVAHAPKMGAVYLKLLLA